MPAVPDRWVRTRERISLRPGADNPSAFQSIGVLMGRGPAGFEQLREHEELVSIPPRPALPLLEGLLRREREFFIDNLQVRIHFIIEMIWWTGLAPWDFEFPFPGCLISTIIGSAHSHCPLRYLRCRPLVSPCWHAACGLRCQSVVRCPLSGLQRNFLNNPQLDHPQPLLYAIP